MAFWQSKEKRESKKERREREARRGAEQEKLGAAVTAAGQAAYKAGVRAYTGVEEPTKAEAKPSFFEDLPEWWPIAAAAGVFLLLRK